MIIRDELDPCRLVPLFVSQKKEELPSPGLVTQPSLWQFATCIPERTTKTDKKPQFQNYRIWLWGVSMRSLSRYMRSLLPSLTFTAEQAMGFPCDCPEPAGSMDLSAENEGPPLWLWDLCSSSAWQTLSPALGCSALQQSSSAQHVLCPSHPFSCRISHLSLNCRKCSCHVD